MLGVTNMNIFISHIHEEFEIAKAIRFELKRCFGSQVDLFLAEDIPLGSNWFDEIRVKLSEADLILALFSPQAAERPWINIEAGYGIMANKKVIPICCLELRKPDLPVVYLLQQAMSIDDENDVDRLLEGIAKSTTAGSLLGDKAKLLECWRTSISAAISEVELIYEKPKKTETYFHIVNKASGGCLDIEDWGKKNGDRIIHYPYHGGDNQLWEIKHVEESYYCIISKHSQKCFEVKDGSDVEGATVNQRNYEGHPNQQWDFTKLQENSYKIVARHSGKCLSVQKDNLSYHTPVIQSSWGDLPSQRWWLKVNVTPV